MGYLFQVKFPSKAAYIKVVPTPNNGSSELISLHHGKDATGAEVIWFRFQKAKYFWDDDKKQFRVSSGHMMHYLMYSACNSV